MRKRNESPTIEIAKDSQRFKLECRFPRNLEQSEKMAWRPQKLWYIQYNFREYERKQPNTTESTETTFVVIQ